MCIPDLTASWFLPLYSKSKQRTIIFLLIDWFCKGLIFFCTNVHQIWAFGMDSGGSTSTVNCIASISVWFRRKEWGMRVIKKNIGQQKSGEGVRKKGRTLLPHPLPLLHFLALVPFFAPLKPKNSIPLSLVFLHSEVYHMEMLATHSGYYNCYELTHCFRLTDFVNNGLPRWFLGALVRSSCTCNIFLKSKLDILYIHIEKSYIVPIVTWLYSFVGSNPWFYQNIRLSCRNIHYIHVHQLES